MIVWIRGLSNANVDDSAATTINPVEETTRESNQFRIAIDIGGCEKR